MKLKETLRMLLIFLIFFDFLFFNIRLGMVNITLLRLVIFVLLIYIVLSSYRRNIKIALNFTYIYSMVFFVVWFTYGIAQLLLVEDYSRAFNQLYYFLIFVFIIICFSINIDRVEWNKLLDFLNRLSFVLVWIGFVEIITGLHLPTSRYSLKQLYNGGVATSVFYNENDFGLFLVLIFPLFLAEITVTKKIFKKYLYLVSICVIFVIIIMNDSKSALLSITIQIILYSIIHSKSSIYQYFVSVVSLLTLSVVLISIKDFFGEFVIELQYKYGSAFVRLNVYKSGLEALKNSHYLGVGPGNFEVGVNFTGTNGIINPHNWWIELLTNYGLPIFVLYMIFYFSMMSKLYNIFKRDKPNNTKYFALFLSWVGFSVGSLGPSSLFYIFVVWLFYAITLGGIHVFHTSEFRDKKDLIEEQYNHGERCSYRSHHFKVNI